MTTRRLWIGSCALTVFMAAAAGYILWIPYDPAALYRAIPADAALVSAHQDLAQRWPRLATNVWLAPFIGVADKSAPTAGAGMSPGLRSAVARVVRLARRDTLFAYLPSPGGAGQPAWMAAAWIGGWSPWVRWATFFGRRPDIKNTGAFGGRTIWELQTPLDDGRRLSFVCGEGVLLACLSADPAAMRHVLLAYDGLIPSAPTLPDLKPAPEQDFQDAFWCRWRDRAGAGTITLAGVLERFDEQGLSATIRLRPSPCRQARLADSIRAAGVEQALGNLPALVLALPLPAIQDRLLATATDSAWLQTTRRILQSDWIRQDANGLVLALFTGEYGGGFGRRPLRMSVPALMAFIRVRQPGDVRRTISRELDALNSRHRLGLILDPSPLAAGAQAVWAIESTGNNIMAALEGDDRPAYTLVGDWMILSSHAGSLVKLARRFQDQAGATAPAPAGWHRALAAANTTGLVWLDLDDGGKAVQLALSLWGLGSLEDRNAARAARKFLDRIRPLQACLLWMEPEGSNAVVRVEIGPHPKP